MFRQYKNGWVNFHSIGLRYVKIALAVNDKQYKEEYNNWKKYISQIVNREEAEKIGYFYAVTEVKVIEGSAVTLPANPLTPTLASKGQEPQESTLTPDDIKGLFSNTLNL